MTCRLAVFISVLLLLVTSTTAPPMARAQQFSPKSARELLELHGIDASQLDRFQDGEPLGVDDEETLIRILQRFPRFPRRLLERWSRQDKRLWTEIAAAPHDRRSEVFRLQGRVTKIERSPLLPEVARRLEFSEYFRVTLRLAESPNTAVVCTRVVPRAWLTADPVDEAAEAVGILLKVGARRGELTELVFAAERVAWYPAQVFLARHGFDVGLLDDVRDDNKKPLSLRDRECFYQLLGVVGRANREEFLTQPHQPLDVVALLQGPQEYQGQLLTLDGIARRAVRVRVDAPDDRERFGLDHYFQIDLFVALNNRAIKLKTPQNREDAPVFADSFPVTVCVPSLPPGLPEGDVLRENVRIHGVFFKLWTYSSDYVSSFDKQMLQVSPMLIGVEPSIIRPEVFVPGLGIGLAGLAVLSSLGMWWGLRRQPPRVVPRAAPGFGRQFFPGRSDQTSVDGEDPQLPDRPDFRNLQ